MKRLFSKIPLRGGRSIFCLPVFGVALMLNMAGTPVMGQGFDLRKFDPLSERPAHVALVADKERLGDTGEVILGVAMDLADGWKTYWRNPGDSGIPPVFDWSGSRNVTGMEVLWPAPERFDLPGDSSFGYKDRVLFPVRVIARNTDAPMEVNLSFSYGVCEQICVPMEDSLALYIPPGPAETSSAAADIGAALMLVPGENKEASGLALEHVALEEGSDALTIVLTSDRSLGDHHLVVEEVDKTGVYFGVPVVEQETPEMARFRVPVDGGPALALKDREVTVTVRDGSRVLSEKALVGYSQTVKEE